MAKDPIITCMIGSLAIIESGRLDLNQRPPAPEAGALPGYATPRNKQTPSIEGRMTHHNMASCLAGGRLSSPELQPATVLAIRENGPRKRIFVICLSYGATTT